MRVVKLGTLLVNVVCVLVLEVWVVESVVAGVAAAVAALNTARARPMVEEATVLVIALQGAAVFHQFVGAATAGHHVAEVVLLMLMEEMVAGTAVAGARP